MEKCPKLSMLKKYICTISINSNWFTLSFIYLLFRNESTFSHKAKKYKNKMLFEMILKNVNIANINLQIYVKILWPQFLMYFLLF